MNYYMPFSNITPYTNQPIKTSILSKAFKNGLNWSTIITNTQKTLNIVNQSIPIIKQIKPVINNTKTMLKVMNEFKKVEIKPTNEEIKEQPKKEKTEEKIIQNQNNPTFFI